MVLSGFAEGQVEDRAATTVMVPSVEQTETRGSTAAHSDPRKHKATVMKRTYPSCPGF